MTIRRFCLVLTMISLSCLGVMAQKPKVHILATGGTIAGVGSSSAQSNYTAGQVAIGTLLDAVPDVNNYADVTGEQVVKIGSQDMMDHIWLTLAKRINVLLSSDEVDGIVITHGTDTMEETAYFLNLTVKSDKPVVLVGAMLPSTAISADGPRNLLNAVVTAAAPESKGKGVLCVMDGKILGAQSLTKTHTLDASTFKAPNDGALGYLHNGLVFYKHTPLKKHTLQSDFDVMSLDKLPKVDIVYTYSNMDPDLVAPLLKNGYKGIVHAGLGNGNIHKDIFPLLIKARKKGIAVVRSSRVPFGPTTLDGEVDDAEFEFVASQDLNPQKARILLMLALTKTTDWKQIQNYFNEY